MMYNKTEAGDREGNRPDVLVIDYKLCVNLYTLQIYDLRLQSG